VAVDFPNVCFVLAHLGNPWMQDAAEVVYKNLNVHADLSGLVVGDGSIFHSDQEADQELLADLRANLKRAFRYAERPNRFLFGSDWPLIPFGPYSEFIRSAIPSEFHDDIFRANAKLLFKV
jgi:hypothetical protein